MNSTPVPGPARAFPAVWWRRATARAATLRTPAVDRALAASGARIAPVLDVITPLGRLLAGISVLGWVLGLAFGWQEAKVAALMGTLLLVLAIGFILGRSIYSVTLDLNRTRVAVGDRAVGGIDVSNASARQLAPSVMELPVGRAVARFRVPRLTAGQTHQDLFTIPTARRAVLLVGPVRTVRQDPFGLLRRAVRWTGAVELFVHPVTTALDGASAGFIRDLEGVPTRDLSDSDVSFHALRDYVPGDDLRHVHWKSTARTGTMMVRQFEETRRSHIALSLSTAATDYLEPGDFELAVSVAASIGRQAIAEQRKLDVLTQTGPLRTDSGRRLLDDLTRVQAADGCAALATLSRTTADAVPNASVAFLITGPGTTAAQLRAAAMHVPLGVRALAIRCGGSLETGRSGIGELTVLSLGALDDLGLLLRKAAA
ncbi:DUF58 domain-containing protein [Paeniglutamicibacter cryotolerans]|uniref:Uncharacterized protein (DUF58 family) n=1 Tax=Paeniglutamicibacter cryotolerans TaxID=670079 RepID=A0A839QMP4_9MICC|nr:DUF58 domain-containing protein [Paeniglutamicibacter cryotolerans]MBB2996034.1 uncharacterized protein (DUF58 family) [Paeniglutamicibacter cryotolerans]